MAEIRFSCIFGCAEVGREPAMRSTCCKMGFSPNRSAPTQFKPDQSGNPAGKPKGTLNGTTLALEALLDG